MAREITHNNFEISLVVFMLNIITNHAITYTNRMEKCKIVLLLPTENLMEDTPHL